MSIILSFAIIITLVALSYLRYKRKANNVKENQNDAYAAEGLETRMFNFEINEEKCGNRSIKQSKICGIMERIVCK